MLAKIKFGTILARDGLSANCSEALGAAFILPPLQAIIVVQSVSKKVSSKFCVLGTIRFFASSPRRSRAN